MTLTLDTNVLIELVRGGRPLVRQRFDQALMGDMRLVTSLIVLHELLVGCELHHDRTGEMDRVAALLSRAPVQVFDELDIHAAAVLKAELRRKGRNIGAYDLLIAGQALARDWTVVTANAREFAAVDGLKVIDWTVPAD